MRRWLLRVGWPERSEGKSRRTKETWLRRSRKDATLDRLDEFAAEMHRIQAANTRK
jgi:hypothetical protein